MDKEVKNTILQVGIVYGAFVLLVKPLTSMFGATTEEAAAIQSVDHTEERNNAFSEQFAPMRAHFNSSFQAGDTGGMDIAAYIKYFKDQWDDLDPVPAMDGTHGIIDAITGAEFIKDSFSFWKSHLTGNTYDVLPVFNAVRSKEQVASIASVLYYLYGIHLWQYLKEGNGLMWRGLSPTDLKYIVDRVNSLPDIL